MNLSIYNFYLSKSDCATVEFSALRGGQATWQKNNMPRIHVWNLRIVLVAQPLHPLLAHPLLAIVRANIQQLLKSNLTQSLLLLK
jgi:hypothetical protein